MWWSRRFIRIGSAIARDRMLMIKSLKTFIQGLAGPAGRADYGDSRLAVAALLIRVASIRGQMSGEQRDKLGVLLKDCFDLDSAATNELIDAAINAEKEAVDLYHFTSRLNGSEVRHRRIVGMMWDLLYVRERINELEYNMVWRAADLLGVPSRERLELRRYAAQKAAFVPAEQSGRDFFLGPDL
jgi:uncharacterized tellurite resistance protein B-like protein